VALELKHGSKAGAIRTQIDVLIALTVLAMHTQQGKYRWGYAWSLAEPLAMVSILALAHLVIRLISPLNMPPMLFMVLGCVPWFMFRAIMQHTFKSLNSRRVVLGLGHVTPLDVIFSSALTEFVTYSVIMILFLSVGVALEGNFPPRQPLGVIAMFVLAAVFGCGVGMIFAGLFRYFRPVEKTMMLINRAGIWTSGAFFVVQQLPPSTWPYLTLNPMLHVDELMRQFWFSTYQSPIANPLYILECLVGVFTLALALERKTRSIPIQ